MNTPIPFSLTEYTAFLTSLSMQTTKYLQNAPEGYLKITHVRGHVRYLHQLPGKNAPCRYLSIDQIVLIRQLARKGYDANVRRLLSARLKESDILSAVVPEGTVVPYLFRSLYESLDTIFYKMKPDRQALVDPIIPTTSQFTEQWLNKPYEGLAFRPDDHTSYYTQADVRVRSKSELYIGNALILAQIPNKYECPLYLTERTLYPDFTVLDPSLRCEKYIEHCGMMDDPDYSNAFIRKINLYEANNIIPGNALFLTFESSKLPLDTRSVDRMIRRLLL